MTGKTCFLVYTQAADSSHTALHADDVIDGEGKADGEEEEGTGLEAILVPVVGVEAVVVGENQDGETGGVKHRDGVVGGARGMRRRWCFAAVRAVYVCVCLYGGTTSLCVLLWKGRVPTAKRRGVVVEGRLVGEWSQGRRCSKVVAGYCARAEERGIARTAANKYLYVTTTGGGSRVPWRDVLPSLHFTCESWG